MTNSIYCPFCHKYVSLNDRGSFASRHGRYWIGECNACFKCVIINDSSNEVFPLPIPKSVDERIPQSIRHDFEEALKCLSLPAYRASAVMARRALQCICLDKGADEKAKLEKQIDWLFDQGIITKDLKEWAHEVRYVGNDAAHPKKPNEDPLITKEDAEEVLQLLEQFCSVLYVAPAIAESRRQARSTI